MDVFFLGIADYLKVGTKIQYKTLEMQTFQHLFLNIPFNVMLALFKIGDGKASKRCRQSIALPPAKGKRAGASLGKTCRVPRFLRKEGFSQKHLIPTYV